MPTENENKVESLIDVGEAEGAEINLDQKGEPEKVEAPAEEKIEIEQVPQDKTYENERETKLEKKEDKDEVKEYSEGVQKRIAKLTRKMREAERQKEEAIAFAEATNRQKSDLEGRLSKLDKSYYKIRFKYALGSRKAYKEGNKSRPFCKSMMARTEQGIIYKLEDINKASKVAFEKAAKLPMHKDQAYSLFKFKGGVYCRHKWVQVLYKIKKSSLKEGKKGSKNLDDYKRVKEVPQSVKRSPAGSKKAKIAPVNMPNQGHYPGVK